MPISIWRFSRLLTQGVPALVVLADVAVAPLLRQVVRLVRRLVGDVREERLAVAAVGVDVGDQLVGVGLRRVEVLRQAPQVAPVLGVERLGVGGREVPVVPVAAHPVEQREVALEAARGRDLGRLLAQVPLADHVGVVAGVLEELRQRGDAVVEVALVAVQAHLVRRRKLAHVAEAVEVRVDAGEQHRPGGGAARVGVEVREAHALPGQRVEVRRLDLAAEHAHVGEAHVVAEDDDDVRPAGRVLGAAARSDWRRRATASRRDRYIARTRLHC